jgi:hypothetical protein
MMLTLGAAVGLIAGASDMVWFNVLLTVGALVVWIPAGFVAMRMVRRRKVTAA